MAPPPSTTIPPFVGLIVRVVTVICLLISLILIASNTHTVSTDYGDLKIKFKDFYAYRYLISTVVIGLAYSLLQTALTIFLVTTGNRLGGEGFCLFDFYGDKFMSHFLVTGAAASFGMTEDMRRIDLVEQLTGNKFLDTANAAASLCFLGFFFTAVSSVFSSYALPRKAN